MGRGEIGGYRRFDLKFSLECIDSLRVILTSPLEVGMHAYRMNSETLKDQVDLIAADFSDDLSDFLGGQFEHFVLSSRPRRHLWLALLDISPAAAKSALVRFGWDAEPAELINWVLDEQTPLLWPVLRRCMPAAALRKGWYLQAARHLRIRPRTGRIWCHVGSMRLTDWAATLALSPNLIEPSVITLMDGDERRARAVSDLYALAVGNGRDSSSLRQAICAATDMIGLETLLARSIQADQLPVAPMPDEAALLPIRTAKQLSTFGHQLRNCMARTRGSMGFRDRSHAFFMWRGEAEGDAMVRVAPDHLGWRLAEVRLANNRRPSPALYRRIADAFADVTP